MAKYEDPVEWVVNEVVDGFPSTHFIRTLEGKHAIVGGDCEKDELVEFTFVNSDTGYRYENDDVIERMNMAQWRMACDKLLEAILGRNGYDIDAYDWPTPMPSVTKKSDVEDNDVVESVTVVFKVDHDTYKAVKRCLEVMTKDAEKEMCVEVCPECDTEFRYDEDSSKLVAICPNCSAVVVLCNECKSHLNDGTCIPGECEAIRVASKVIPAKMCK